MVVCHWLGKKVFLKIKDNKVFIGKIVDEDESSLTIVDKFNFRIQINKQEILILKEEF